MKKILYLLLIFPFLFSACFNGSEKQDSPNIVVFLVDDLGWNDTSLDLAGAPSKYNERYQTPNLETLAEHGITFTHARTNAICVPSRVSLLTGQNFMRHQVKGDIIPQVNGRRTLDFPPGKTISEVEQMLPAVLKRNGYYTIHAGKYHACHLCPPEKSPTPEAAGFDVNIGGTGYGAPASYYAVDSFQRPNAPQKQPMPGLEEYFGKNVHLTEALTLESIKEVRGAVDRGQPFFLYLAHYAVHTPIQEHRPYRDDIELMEGEGEDEAGYASMIEGVDVSLGQVMKALEELDIVDHTLLIFYSDNGGRVLWRGQYSLHGPYGFNYPLRSGKASNYEGGIRVPCVVRWPGHTGVDKRSSAPLMIEDIYTTVLSAAGIALAENYTVDGMDWSGVLSGDTIPNDFEDRSLFFFMPYRFDGIEYNGPNFADGGVATSVSIIKNEWKLLYFFEEEVFELYHLKEDMGEQKNLIVSHLDKALELIKELDQNMQEKQVEILPVFIPEKKGVSWPLEAWEGKRN